MSGNEFLEALRGRLRGVPEEDIERSLEYYREMIGDSMEEGCSEEEAVAALGSVDEAVTAVLSGISADRIVREPSARNTKGPKASKVLAIAGSPLWAPVLIALAAAALAVFTSMWACFIALCAVPVALCDGALYGIIEAVYCAMGGYEFTALFFAGAAIVCAGLAVFAFPGCRAVWRGMRKLTAALFRACGRRKSK